MGFTTLQTAIAKRHLTEGAGLDPLLLCTLSFVATHKFIPIAQLGALGGARSGREICV